ncbi:putative integral membrane protein [Desulfosporosinus sp. I2]|uniref:LapA family protein n=1 Tax=Desulfosporosinus sp. I2 TaxID=1617025 RepID=UPI0005EF9ACF|nr:LapA family protein [Desulfosporosinus sp. I2]KJR45749.1 putative integral membrane protein [Desulfosporosinus sp. I2]
MVVLILSLICSLFIAIFAVQNASLVTINLFWFTKQVPLVLVILGSTFAGALIMLLLAIWRELRLKLRPKQKQKDEILNNELVGQSVTPTLKQSDDSN